MLRAQLWCSSWKGEGGTIHKRGVYCSWSVLFLELELFLLRQFMKRL